MTGLKIALLVPNLTLRRGLERASTNLANAFAQAGHQVRLISVYSEAGAAYALDDRVELRHLGLNGTVSNQVQRLVKLTRTVRALAGPTRDADVVIACEGMLAVNAALLRLRRPRQRAIAWEHLLSELAPFSFRLLRMLTYPALDAVVVLNEHDKAQYQSWGYRRVENIPNPNLLKDDAPANYHEPRAVSVGAHTADRVKGFDRLIQESAATLRSHPGWHIRIIGRDVPGSDLQELARSNGVERSVELVGPVEDISAQYRQASFMVVASRHESLSMVILEAKAHGLATLAYDVPYGPREIIEDGVDGFLVPDGDQVAFQRRLAELMEDEALRRRLGEAARTSASRYSPEAIVERWEPLLRA